MALSEQTVNKHNLKRAEVFAKHGLGDHDVAFAHPSYLGEGTDECLLCGKKGLRYLFAIRFDKPDALTALGKVATGLIRTEEVTLKVIGSKCIEDWLDAIPESAAKLEALKKWDTEMKKAKAAKAKNAVASTLKKAGYDSQADLSQALHEARINVTATGASLSWYTIKKLKTYAKKMAGGKVKSASTVKTALKYLHEAKLAIAATGKPVPAATTPATKVDPDLAHLSGEIAGVIMKARAAWKAGKDNLNAFEQEAITDIANKLKEWESFASDKQEKFFLNLIAKAEAGDKPKAAPKAPKAPKAKPGDDAWISASEIAGARY